MQNHAARLTTVDELESSGPTVLFDGDCNLCNGAVRFVIARDPAGRVRFASLQSDVGRRLLKRYGGAPAASYSEAPDPALDTTSDEAAGGAPVGDTVLLIEAGRLYARSTAALRLAGHMRAPWPALKALLGVPEPLRDALYSFVSRRRYRWFGRTDACRLPSPAEAARFLS